MLPGQLSGSANMLTWHVVPWWYNVFAWQLLTSSMRVVMSTSQKLLSG
jgi:hypothetical protein